MKRNQPYHKHWYQILSFQIPGTERYRRPLI